jgi:hypothetical protein
MSISLGIVGDVCPLSVLLWVILRRINYSSLSSEEEKEVWSVVVR